LNEGTISIVVAVRNGARTLQRCIDSVRNQAYPHKELIIVDGKSTDGTLEILSCNANAISWWISEPDIGIYAAWNKALLHVKGEWICFLGADDYLWDRDALGRIASRLSVIGTSARVVYGQVNLVNDNGDVLGTFGKRWCELRSSFLAGEALNIHQATFHHRSLFERHGRFDESFRIAGDYELLLRELRNNEALYVPCVVTAMQHGGISSNPSSKAATIREIIRARGMHGLALSLNLAAARLRANIHAVLYRVAGQRVSSVAADMYRLLTGRGRLWTKNETGQNGVQK
jgi:glycosyltransferase involved in cell wall biosynthesis